MNGIEKKTWPLASTSYFKKGSSLAAVAIPLLLAIGVGYTLYHFRGAWLNSRTRLISVIAGGGVALLGAIAINLYLFRRHQAKGGGTEGELPAPGNTSNVGEFGKAQINTNGSRENSGMSAMDPLGLTAPTSEQQANEKSVKGNDEAISGGKDNPLDIERFQYRPSDEYKKYVDEVVKFHTDYGVWANINWIDGYEPTIDEGRKVRFAPWEVKAILFYTAPFDVGFTLINGFLGDGNNIESPRLEIICKQYPTLKNKEYLELCIQHLTLAVEKLPTCRHKLFRGSVCHWSSERLKDGTVFELNRFTSWSVNPLDAQHFAARSMDNLSKATNNSHIAIRNNYKVIYLIEEPKKARDNRHFNSVEGEALFLPGTQFKVLSSNKVNTNGSVEVCGETFFERDVDYVLLLEEL